VIDALSFCQLFDKINIIATNGVNGAERDKINNYLRQYGYGTGYSGAIEPPIPLDESHLSEK